VIDHKAYASREQFEATLDSYLRSMHVEIIALAGFMRVLTAGFIAGWEGRMINIHPSLLPAYKGLHTHERALADGAKLHGCSVHLVTPELDGGPVLMQAEVPVLPGDTPDSLAQRVLIEEHKLYPRALAMLAGRLARKDTE
jgi:phosphoribosylglycinamide formyltransferase-1